MLTPVQKKILMFLQGDLPLESAPYRGLARQLGIGEPAVAAEIARLRQKGYIRRFGALLDHYAVGLKKNCLCAWNVPPERVSRFAGFAVRPAQVSHCYQRRRAPQWPYNLYTMIHGRSRPECLRVIKTIARESGVRDYVILWTLGRLKKISPAYRLSAASSTRVKSG